MEVAWTKTFLRYNVQWWALINHCSESFNCVISDSYAEKYFGKVVHTRKVCKALLSRTSQGNLCLRRNRNEWFIEVHFLFCGAAYVPGDLWTLECWRTTRRKRLARCTWSSASTAASSACAPWKVNFCQKFKFRLNFDFLYRYWCGLQMAKWRSRVRATIIRTDAHIDTCAMALITLSR